MSALCQSTALGFQLMISICFHLACCVCYYGFCSCQCLRVSRCWCCGCSQCFCFLVHGCCDFHCFCLCCMRCLPCPVSLCLGSTLCLEDSNARKNTQPLRLPSSKMRLRTSARWAINALASSAVPLWHQPSLRARGSFWNGWPATREEGGRTNSSDPNLECAHWQYGQKMTKASDLIIFHLLVNGEAVGGANHDSSLMAGDRRKGFSGFSNLRLTIFST